MGAAMWLLGAGALVAAVVTLVLSLKNVFWAIISLMVTLALVITSAWLAFYHHDTPAQTSSRSCEADSISGVSFVSPADGESVAEYETIQGRASCSYVGNSKQVIEVAIQYEQTYYPEAEVNSNDINSNGYWDATDIKIGKPQDSRVQFRVVLFAVSASDAKWISQQRTSLQDSGQWDNQGISLANLGQSLASEDVVRS